LFGALLITSVWATAAPPATALAAAGPFTCEPVFYEVDTGQLSILNPTGGAPILIGTQQPNYNAMGYDTSNNYLYAISTATGTMGDLLQIADDGSTTNLGLPTGLPSASYVSGDYDSGVGNPESGDLVISAPSSTWYAIDVTATPPTATALAILGHPSGDDQVDIGSVMYQLTGDTLYSIDLLNNTASAATVTGLPATGTYGSGWSDQENGLFFSLNNTGLIYQITGYTGSNPVATQPYTGPVSGNDDGASCKLAESTFDAPVANNDTYSVMSGQTLDVAAPGVLGNDDGAGLTVDTPDTTSPAHGTLTVSSDGSFAYTPVLGYAGTDTFTYSDVDEFGRDSNTATVTITVIPPAPPTTSPESGTTPYDTPITLTAPTTTGVGPFTYALVTTPPSVDGAAGINPSTGAVTFAPAAGYSGHVPMFTYTATDVYGQQSAPADVTVTVSPHAYPASKTGLAGEPVTLTVTGADGVGPFTYLVVASTLPPAQDGSAVMDPTTGEVEFDPAPGFIGTVTFQYTATDAGGVTSPPATVTISLVEIPVRVPTTGAGLGDSAYAAIGVMLMLLGLLALGTGLRRRRADR
jgi:hypothetical protein